MTTRRSIEVVVAGAMRELAETHRAYKAVLVSETASEHRQQFIYEQYCAARERVVALAEKLYPSGATRTRKKSAA